MTISRALEATLQLAFADARRRRHEYVLLEHLLHALCADPTAGKLLRACGANLGRLQGGLEEFLAKQPSLAAGSEVPEPKQTVAFWRVIQRAALHAQGAGREDIDGGNVVASL